MGGPPMNSAAHHQPKIPTRKGAYHGRLAHEVRRPPPTQNPNKPRSVSWAARPWTPPLTTNPKSQQAKDRILGGPPRNSSYLKLVGFFESPW